MLISTPTTQRQHSSSSFYDGSTKNVYAGMTKFLSNGNRISLTLLGTKDAGTRGTYAADSELAKGATERL
ncbi:hypothetical protein PM082_021223 [Marasmius tenuissimus]|nr:hypothetical protein PM082_021223 [Marasmius tenuissimus]